MTSIKILQVFVSLLSLNLYASAQMYGYPTPYPYLQQQYPVYGGDVNSYPAQGYPQIYPQTYPAYPAYPSIPSYAPQYPTYPSYPGYPPVGYPNYPEQQYPVVPTQYPPVTNSEQPQYPVGSTQLPPGTNIYPSNYNVPFPQTVQTPYGNIPVEIIDVEESIDRQVGRNETEGSQKLTPVLSDSKSIHDVLSYPTKTTKYVKTAPSQTKIVRTFEPKGGKIHVDVQTASPPVKESDNEVENTEEDEDNDEDNETTTAKQFSIFG